MAEESPETPTTGNPESVHDEVVHSESTEKKEEESDKPGTEEKADAKSTDEEQKLVQKPTPTPKRDGECVSPTPSGEELPDGEIEQIIIKSTDILQFCRDKVHQQKIDSHSLAFMLLRIKESVEAYNHDYLPTLNSFLVNADNITADYYARMCCSLPKYGDYVKAIEAQQSDPIAAGGDNPVGKTQLHGLVKNVTDNYHASAMNLKSDRAVLKDVNSSMNDRRDIPNRVLIPMPNWMGIQDNINCQLESIRDQTFKISAYIDFLKQGETKKGPALDLSALEKKDEKEKKISTTDY